MPGVFLNSLYGFPQIIRDGFAAAKIQSQVTIIILYFQDTEKFLPIDRTVSYRQVRGVDGIIVGNIRPTIQLSLIINLGVFFLLDRMGKEIISRGIIAGTLIWGVYLIVLIFG